MARAWAVILRGRRWVVLVCVVGGGLMFVVGALIDSRSLAVTGLLSAVGVSLLVAVVHCGVFAATTAATTACSGAGSRPEPQARCRTAEGPAKSAGIALLPCDDSGSPGVHLTHQRRRRSRVRSDRGRIAGRFRPERHPGAARGAPEPPGTRRRRGTPRHRRLRMPGP